MPDYIVKQGDCINSIAYEFGFFPKTIWDHPNNSFLKELRKDPGILLDGDKVFVPENGQKSISVKSDMKASFKLKGVPARLHIKFYDFKGEALANSHYKLDVDGKIIEDKLNNEGLLDISISPNAKKATIIIGNELSAIKYEINLGYLNPLDTTSGVKARLNNLGYNCGEENEEFDMLTQMAILSFQKKYELMPLDGKIGSQFIRKLKEVFGT
jgi:N-acetylmuramoyl-L-alanine amidase